MISNKKTLYSVKLHLIAICVGLVTSTEAQWVVDDYGCRTPDGGVGSCIPIKDCKPITDAVQNSSPLSQHAIETLRSYHCGVTKTSVKVCCPNSPILMERIAINIPTTIEQAPDNVCSTPTRGVGSCIPIKECKPIIDFIQNSSPLSQNAIKMLQGYQCRDISNSAKVCCPNSPIVTETVNVRLPTIIEQPPDDRCRTPDRSVGSCVPIKNCKPIIEFIQTSSPLSKNAIETLRSYQCAATSSSVKVCCPNSPTVIETINITASTIIEQPPDVTSHGNLNLLPYECGLQFGVPRITGGNKTVLFEFPWMALLSYESATGIDFHCAGTIINEWYILTAAHCVTNLSTLKLVGVRLGEYNISSTVDCEKEPFGDEYCAPPVQDITVAEVIPHPKYNFTSITNDIGLIRLVSPINISVENAKPICLPVTEAVRNRNFTNVNLTVTGWGITEMRRKSPDLLKVDVPVIAEEDCSVAYKRSSAVITRKQICAGGRNKKDSCSGDSGGPLQTSLGYNNDVRVIQFGVVSFGSKFCGREGVPGVYTRVDYYMDWILDNMKP